MGTTIESSWENERLKEEIERLRAELAAVPDIRVQEAALVGENMILKARVTELEAVIKSHGIPVKTFAGGEAHYCIGEANASS